MANTLTPIDVYGIINAMNQEMFGSSATLQAIDTSTFVTVGEAMLRTGYTNTLDALSNVIGRTIFAVRRYNGKFKPILKTPAEWGGIERKISYYAKPMQESGNFNTDVNGTQLDDGSSIDPWIISKKYPLEINFCGVKTIEYQITVFRSQLRGAFQSEAAFADFLSAMMVDVVNDLESKVEAENRLMILNAIGATYDVGATRSKVNLVTEYNAKYGTSYTAAQLMTTYLPDLMAFFVSRLKGDMRLMEERNELFHIYPAKNDDSGNALQLLRHTPAEDRRLILYEPLFRDEATNVFPSLFSTSELRIENYEPVEYWQNVNDPMAVDITPNELDVSTGESQNGSQVQLSYVLGLLFDRDAITSSIKFESANSTELNARGLYTNQFWHFANNYKLDQTENMILYYLA